MNGSVLYSFTASFTASAFCIDDDSYRVASVTLKGVLMGLGLLPCRGARGFSPCALDQYRVIYKQFFPNNY